MRKRFDIAQTKGRWPGILAALGVDSKTLSRHNVPCPFCGGKDRFRFTNYEGMGLWTCNQCGPGNGVQFVQRFLETDFVGAMKKIEAVLPAIEIKQEPKKEKPRAALNAHWKSARPLSSGPDCDMAAQYLGGRLVWVDPPSTELRCKDEMWYWEDGKRKAVYHAMLARVRDAEGKPTTLHVTYLQDGKKAPVPSPKKILSEMGAGAHIRLFPAGPVLAVAEGIETALAVRRATGMPVWAGISANGLRQLVIPPEVEHVYVFADNDPSYTGQAAAYYLANRLVVKGGRRVTVYVPRVGDWADIDNWEDYDGPRA